MSKNKKLLTLLSTTAITGLIVASVNSTAFAKATAIGVNSIDGKVSASDIKVSDFTVNKRYSSDKPAIKSIVITDSETIRVKFSKDVNFTYASNPANYKLLDNKEIDITSHIRGIYSVSGESDRENTDTFYIKLKKFNPNNISEDWRLTNSKYRLAIKNIIDTSSIPNAMDDYSCVLNDNELPKVTGIYANLRTSTDKDKIVVYFSKAMDVSSLTNKNNYRFVNGEGDTKALPQNSAIIVGGDDKSVIIEFPSDYRVLADSSVSTGNPNDVTELVVSGVTDESNNKLEGVAYKSKISSASTGATVEDNSIKVYYNGDDLKVDLHFTRALDQIDINDFTLGGVRPTSASFFGSRVILNYKDGAPATAAEISAHPVIYANGKVNTNPTKIDIIKSQGQQAKLAINSTFTTDEAGGKVCVNNDGSPAVLSKYQSAIYDYQAAPKTVANFWSAKKDANGGTVYITFDTILDINSAIKTDDFVFIGNLGTSLKADSVMISGNTLIFKFNTNNKDFSKFDKQLDIIARSTASLRTEKDLNGNNANYAPSSDDLKQRPVSITE